MPASVLPLRQLQILKNLIGNKDDIELPSVLAPPRLPINEPTLEQNIPDNRYLKINDPTGLKSGNYPQIFADDLVSAAKQHGLDPLRILALGLRESTLGREDPKNPLQFVAQNDDELDETKYIESFPEDAQRQLNIDRSLNRYKFLVGNQTKRTPNDEELNIQAYNGMGRINGGPVPTGVRGDMYGGKTDLIGRRDRPHGKATLAMEELIKQQPDFQKVLK